MCVCVFSVVSTRERIYTFFFFIYRSKHIETAWRVPVAYKIIILYARKAAKLAKQFFFHAKETTRKLLFFCFFFKVIKTFPSTVAESLRHTPHLRRKCHENAVFYFIYSPSCVFFFFVSFAFFNESTVDVYDRDLF